MTLSESELQTISLRDQMNALLSQDNVPVEKLDVLAQIYHQHITRMPADSGDPVERASFLQENLDWLNTFIDKLSAKKLAVAAELTKVQQGKKAKQGYSENN